MDRKAESPCVRIVVVSLEKTEIGGPREMTQWESDIQKNLKSQWWRA